MSCLTLLVSLVLVRRLASLSHSVRVWWGSGALPRLGWTGPEAGPHCPRPRPCLPLAWHTGPAAELQIINITKKHSPRTTRQKPARKPKQMSITFILQTHIFSLAGDCCAGCSGGGGGGSGCAGLYLYFYTSVAGIVATK